MSTTTQLLEGVDQHGTGYRVRVRFPDPVGRHTETGFTTADKANARALELRALRAQGLVPTQATAELTLCEYAEALLARKRTHVSRKTKRKLRERGVEWWERATKPWREGPYAELPVSMLSRVKLEAAIMDRAAVVLKTARDEHAGLNATLRFAQSQGASFDPSLLAIERLPVTPRKRLALDVELLMLLVSCVPPYAQRLVLFLATTGLRIGEAFTLTDDRFDGEAVFVPAELCKEGVDKWVELTAEEVVLVREMIGGLRLVDDSATAHLPARAAGTSLIFPAKTGVAWRHFQFLRLVWYKALHDAAVKWREQQGYPAAVPTPYDRKSPAERAAKWRAEHGHIAAVPTPFCGFEPHDLRATAATFMRDAGFAREDAAARLGHADSGELLDRLYDQGDRRTRTRRAIDKLAPQGLLTLHAEAAETRSTTSASGSLDAARGGAS